MAEQVIEFLLPKKLSTNKIYEGVHWSERKDHKDAYLRDFIEVARKIKPVDNCEIEFEFGFKSRPLDCDNCSYMVKLLIDCLRHYRKIADDTPEYIRSIKISSKKSNKDNVLIKIFG